MFSDWWNVRRSSTVFIGWISVGFLSEGGGFPTDLHNSCCQGSPRASSDLVLLQNPLRTDLLSIRAEPDHDIIPSQPMLNLPLLYSEFLSTKDTDECFPSNPVLILPVFFYKGGVIAVFQCSTAVLASDDVQMLTFLLRAGFITAVLCLINKRQQVILRYDTTLLSVQPECFFVFYFIPGSLI